MRVKKQKRHRKIVRFYTACYGFRPPFKVLCDGTFVHHLLVNGITPADDALSNLLGSPVKLFTTRYSNASSIWLLYKLYFITSEAWLFSFPMLGWRCSCVLAELKKLGHSVSESLDAAQQLLTARSLSHHTSLVSSRLMLKKLEGRWKVLYELLSVV